MRLRFILGLTVITSVLAVPLSAEEAAPDSMDEYKRITNERADKIVATLGINDNAERLQVRELIAEWYRTLSMAQVGLESFAPRDKIAEALLAAHRRFVAQLEARLSPEQVELVKDGLTYGVVPRTYDGYLDLLPTLTAEQKIEIKSQLLEAREYALDGFSADAKHAIFGKYKGRINNYLSNAGYDLKQAERDRAAKQPKNRRPRQPIGRSC
jgi:hypothetical protein